MFCKFNGSKLAGPQLLQDLIVLVNAGNKRHISGGGACHEMPNHVVLLLLSQLPMHLHEQKRRCSHLFHGLEDLLRIRHLSHSFK